MRATDKGQSGIFGNHEVANPARLWACFQVDAFTRTKFAGNPAGVVLGADSLSDEEMQSIAREFNNSETAFVLASSAADHDLRVRFFTPSCEVPSCGHATIAANYVRSLYEHRPPESVRMLCGAGILRIDTERTPDGDVTVFMHQARPEFRPIATEQKSAILVALGLKETDLDKGCLPLKLCRPGIRKCWSASGTAIP